MSDVSGKVIDYFTGHAIIGATVLFGTFMATSDANGNFNLTNLPPTIYTITVIHKDYETTSFSADLSVNQAYSFEPFKIKPIFRAL